MQNPTEEPPLRLNVGCGNNRIEGYTNIDCEGSTGPDILADIRHGLPFDSDAVEEILFFHTIEHIEERYHENIFREFHRVLEPGGTLLVSYPEFMICAQNYIDNYRGMREFWKATIYGLQRYKSDYHVALMDSDVFAERLQEWGFKDIEYAPESAEPYNTILLAVKGEVPKSYEDLFRYTNSIGIRK
jgi:predicted SAM-dependent methyltransferase